MNKIYKNKGFVFSTLSRMLFLLSYSYLYINNSWLALSEYKSATSAVLNAMLIFLPNIIIPPFSGVIIDRVSKRLLILITAISTCVILLFIKILMGLHGGNTFHLVCIYAQTLCISVAYSILQPAYAALTREVVPNTQLYDAHAYGNSCFQIARAIALGSSGFLIYALSENCIYLFILTLVFMSAILMIILQTQSPHKIQTLEKRKSILSDAFSTLKMMLKNDKIFIVYAAAIFSYLLIMTIPALSAPFVSEVLFGNTIQFGFIEASFSVGAIIGCILLPKFSFFMGMPKKILLISLIQIFVLLAFSFVHYYWLAIILYFSAGITMGLFPIFTAMTQLITKPEWQGRYQSIFLSVASLFIVIEFMLIMFMSQFISVNHIYGIIAVTGIFPIVLLLKYPEYFKMVL